MVETMFFETNPVVMTFKTHLQENLTLKTENLPFSFNSNMLFIQEYVEQNLIQCIMFPTSVKVFNSQIMFSTK